jgi:hypothetical protein
MGGENHKHDFEAEMTDNDKLKRLAEAASVYSYGGWKYDPPHNYMHSGRISGQGGYPVVATVQWPVPTVDSSALGGRDVSSFVGEFIAAANPQAILALFAENERLKERGRHLDMVGRDQAVRVMREATRAKLAEDQRDEAVALLRETHEAYSVWTWKPRRQERADNAIVAFLALITESERLKARNIEKAAPPAGAMMEARKPDQHRGAAVVNLIPEMTDPLGRHWRQPVGVRNLEMDDTHVLIPLALKSAFCSYDRSYPSGTYSGKTWLRSNRGTDWLVWYGELLPDDEIAIGARIILWI